MKKMNKIMIAVLMVLMLGLSVAVWATEGSLTLQLEPSVTEVGAGDTFDVVVSIGENPGILQAQFELTYDAEAVQVLSVSTENTVFNSEALTVNTETAGKVAIGLEKIAVEENAEAVVHTAAGQLVTVQFQVVENYEGTISMTMLALPGTFLDANGEVGTTVMDVTCEVTAVHVHKEVTVSGTEPTCTQPGLSDGVTCETCGVTLQEQLPLDATGHTEVEDAAQEPTCTVPGLTAGSHCGTCGETIVAQDPVDAPGHIHGEAVRENEIYASCVEDGSYEAVVYCTVCNEELSRSNRITLANGDHVFATQQERVEPNCIDDGYIRMACGCGETKDTVLSATGHKEVIDEGVEATCTQPGLTNGSHCETCGETLEERQTIEAKGHTEKTLSGYAATCTEPGLTDGKVCEECGTILEAQAQTDLVPHSDEVIYGFAPTCTDVGKTDGVSCAICNMVIVAQREIAAVGHTSMDVEEKIPTCAEDGHTAGTKCAICDEVLSGCTKIDSLPHTEVILPAQDANCSMTGLTEGRYCSVCSEVTVKQLLVPKTDHNAKPIDPIAPTCSSVGWTEGSRCFNCNEVLVHPTEVPALPHDEMVIPGKEATCTEPGMTTGCICNACGTFLTVQQEIPAKGHGYDNACDTDCNHCGATRLSSQHEYGNWYTVRPATEESTGEEAHACVHCGHMETRILSKLIPQENGRKGTVIMAFAVMIISAGGIAVALHMRRKQ